MSISLTTDPIMPDSENTVSGANSLGVFLGTDGETVSEANTMAIMGGNVGIGTVAPSSGTGGPLKLDVEGNVGAQNYCDADGNNCFTATDVGSGSNLWEEVSGVLRPVSASPKVAWGIGSHATGWGSTAFGIESLARGEGSVAWGLGDTDGDSHPPTADGDGSTAWGAVTYANGYLSTVWGSHNHANGWGSTAWGYRSRANGWGSTAWGIGSHAGSYLETSLGRYPLNTAGNATSWVATDTLFEIGNGTADNARSNALTVLKNGNVGIGTASPQSALHIPDGKYLQIEDNNAGAPPAADCDHSSEFGRLSIGAANNRFYICMGAAGWGYTSISTIPMPP